MKIPLFDIDWTLLQGGNPAHHTAFAFALHTVYKLMSASIEDIDPNGKIDTQILMEIALQRGIDEQSARLKIPEALQVMVNYYSSEVGTYISPPMPGVIQLLEQLKANQMPCGLLTGNIENIGRDKLSKAGINQYLPFGGFGNEAYRRVDLIEIARQKAERTLQRQVSKSDLVIVGDSVLDVECAREGGILSIAVATGKHSADQLKQAGADLTVVTLTELDSVLRFLN